MIQTDHNGRSGGREGLVSHGTGSRCRSALYRGARSMIGCHAGARARKSRRRLALLVTAAPPAVAQWLGTDVFFDSYLAILQT
jgi:hypothetical protein